MTALEEVLPAERARRFELSAVWLEVAGIVVILGVAAFLRFYRLAALPPGIDLDEARNGVEVLGVLAGKHPLFFTQYDPREPAFIYSLALAVRALGNTALPMHLTSALWSLAGVAATYLVARQWFGRGVAMLATAGMAASLWALTMSRWAERDITLPPFLLLFLFFLWRGFERRSQWSFIASGVFASVCLYAYVAARILPLFILALLCVQWLANPKGFAAYWRGLLAGLAAAALTAAPLVVYFARHTNVFFGRIAYISTLSAALPGLPAEPVWRTTLSTLGMFFVRGDLNWRDNVPGQPVVAWWLAAPFCLGVLLTLRFAAAPAKDVLRLHLGADAPAWAGAVEPRPCAWLLLWQLALLVPAFLSRPSPQFDRTIGALPSTYILLALGLAAGCQWLRRHGLGVAGWTAAGALLALEAIVTYHDYFQVYASADPPLHVFEYGQVTDAAVLNDRQPAPQQTVLFLGAQSSIPVHYLAPRYDSSLWMEDYSQLLPLPAGPGPITYVFGAPSLPGLGQESILERYFPSASVIGRATFPNTQQAARVYQVSSDQIREFEGAQRHVGADYGGKALLESINIEPTHLAVKPGQQVRLGLSWRMIAGSHDNYDAFVHVVDASGKQVAQDDRQGLPTAGWQEGQVFLSLHEFSLPANAALGPYRVLAGLDRLSADTQPARSLGELGPQTQVLELDLGP